MLPGIRFGTPELTAMLRRRALKMNGAFVVLLTLFTAVAVFAGEGGLMNSTSLWQTAFGEKSTSTSSFTTTVTDFEGFAAGTVNAQFGWSSLGAAGSGCGVYDHAIVNNVGAPASFGSKSLRMSNAVTSGCFADHTFTASVPNEAGETSAVNGGLSGGTRQKTFAAEWTFISADPGNVQNGLSVVASPDRGDGARMSWVQMTDTPTGIDINFNDYQHAINDFVQTTIANDLDRTVPHTIRIEMTFVDGIANDVVRVYVDGALAHTGTSWEDYFRDEEGNPTRTVDSILFRTGGTAVPATLGKGFLIDGLSVGSASPTVTASNPVAPSNWIFFNEGANGSGSYVTGPATPPIGFGSARLTVDDNGRHNLATLAYAGTRFDQLTQLSYSTYQNNNTNTAAAISLQFGVDYNLSDADTSFQGRLVYEPYMNGTVQQGVWQTWSPLGGKFWSTRAPFNATCSQATPCTLAQVLATWPNAGIHADTAGGLGILILRAGGPVTGGFDGNVDNLTIGVGSSATTWNFEAINSIVVDDDGLGSAADCDAATPASTTIAAGYAAANAGDTIRVCPGTYPISSTIAISKPNLTILGVGASRPVIQIPTSTGYGFTVGASDVTFDNLEIQKADLGSPHNMMLIQGNNFKAQNNLIYGPNPGGTWNTTGLVSRAFEVTAGLTGLLIQNNTIHTLRQPAYINVSSGSILNNNVSGTKGWVIDGANLTFTGNTWGEPQNQDCDIALLPTVNPANYTPLLGLSTANDNAFVCAQFAGGENGRATAFVDDNAAPGGNGSDNTNYQSINTAVAGTLNGGTVEVAAGGYTEDVTVGKSVLINGAGSASTTVIGAIGGSGATFTVQASNVEIRRLRITRAGNNATDWNNPGLNSAGVAVQGLTTTGLNLHDNLITGNRTGIDINNSNGHTVRNNVISDNRTGILMRNQTDNLTVVENEITNNWTVGVLFLDASGGTNLPVQTALGSTFSNNAISGNWYGQIVDRQSGGSLPAPGANLKNFGSNWLGGSNPVVTTANSTEPGYAAQIPVAFGGTAVAPGGQPDIAGPASANLDFSPFLGSGTDSNVETTPGRGTFGFQGGFNVLNVSAQSPQAVGSLSNIQEGINLVTAGGTLNILNGTYTGDVDVNKLLNLKGTPTIVGTLSTSVAGAQISPGFSPGIINSGNLSLIAGSTLNIEVNGTVAGTGYDQINVTGSVSLGGATLNVTTAFTPTAGNTFTIINNDGADAVTGTFAGLPEGTVFFVGGNSFSISYAGGSGNDVVLTAVSLCSAVSIPTGVTTRTGDPVTVPVNVDDTTGKSLLSFDMRLTYDPAVVNNPVVSLTPLSAGRVIFVNSSTPGVIIVSVFGSTPFAGAGSLVDVTFNTVGGIGTSTGVNFSSFTFNEGTSCLTTSNGSISVISGAISGTVTYQNSLTVKAVPHTTLNGAGSVNVSTDTDLTGAYTLGGFGAGAYTVTPSKTGNVTNITSFDSALIAQYMVGLASLNANQLLAADVSDNGTISSFDAALIARWLVLLPNTGVTGTWRFTPVNRSYPGGVPADIAGEDFTAILKGEVSGDWVVPTSFAPLAEETLRDDDRIRVAVKDAIGSEGSEVVFPIEVGDMTGRGVVAYQFDLGFDPKVLEPVTDFARSKGTLSQDMTVTYNRIEAGRIRVAVFGAYPVQGRGELLSLAFKLVGPEGSTSALGLDQVILNESKNLALPVDGRAEVTRATNDGPTIFGSLRTSAGTPVTDATVILTSSSGARFRVTSRDDGGFRFTGLVAGESYTVVVNAKRLRFDPQVVGATEGATQLDLIARP